MDSWPLFNTVGVGVKVGWIDSVHLRFFSGNERLTSVPKT